MIPRRRTLAVVTVGLLVVAVAVNLAVRPPGAEAVRRRFQDNLRAAGSAWDPIGVDAGGGVMWTGQAVCRHDGVPYRFTVRCPVDAPELLASVEVAVHGVRDYLNGGREVVLFRGDVNPHGAGLVVVRPRYARGWRGEAAWVEPRAVEVADALRRAARPWWR